MTPQARLAIGDVVEISTNRGYVYAQFSHTTRDGTPLIRVLPGYFRERPKEFTSLVNGPTRYFVPVLVDEAVRKLRMFEKVEHASVPGHALRFPPVVLTSLWERDRKLRWLLWDGRNEWIEQDAPRARSRPHLAIHSPRLVVVDLDRGAEPEPGELFLREPPLQLDQTSTTIQRLGGPTVHFLYFRDRDAAAHAATKLRESWRSVELKETHNDGQHLVMVQTESAGEGEIGAAAERLDAFARELGGEYDGWESGVTRGRQH